MIPHISIITAVYNGEKYLDDSISSILNQTFIDFEFIIINDFSSDSSLNIIKKYLKKDNRIILINNDKNLGSSESRNCGLKIASGKYIAILDQDDISFSERIFIQQKYLEKNKDVFLVGGYVENIDSNGEVLCNQKYWTSSIIIKRLLPYKNCFCHSAIMFRNTGEYFYRSEIIFADDYDLYLQMLSDGKKIKNISEFLIKYRIHGESSSYQNYAKMEVFAAYARIFFYQRKKIKKDNYKDLNSKEILELNIEENYSRIILKARMIAAKKLNNTIELKILKRKFHQMYGFFNIKFLKIIVLKMRYYFSILYKK